MWPRRQTSATNPTYNVPLIHVLTVNQNFDMCKYWWYKYYYVFYFDIIPVSSSVSCSYHCAWGCSCNWRTSRCRIISSFVCFPLCWTGWYRFIVNLEILLILWVLRKKFFESFRLRHNINFSRWGVWAKSKARLFSIIFKKMQPQDCRHRHKQNHLWTVP
jgi:hypothetical protein